MVTPLRTIPREKMTAEQFLSGDETMRPRHLVDGQVYEPDMPTILHQHTLLDVVQILIPLHRKGHLLFAPL